ncbi:Nif11-like leader peptide family natural product precursor [Brasilonema sp. UFV-L1]|uniref:Nif11-like leader peptide family natural product precursor n=1 Tax=Brasilonema sp. UFV-L1 TaxID=2234130 RepID=UPI00145F5405|nr:Nif11-like leader peptide family natural product precursor [Brasilonema sp. UFV-L1]NMG07800.1 Nif11-like leader peptide family natural product precursor [Brasilonema sp. UFV-L1]
MSIESASAFYQRVTTDEAFRTQLQNTASEERTAIIQAAGYDFTPEEWEAATVEILKTAETNTELNDAQLEAIAGGITMVALYGLPRDLRWPVV